MEQLMDVLTGTLVWSKGRPWFAVRYGPAYVLVLESLMLLPQGITADEVEVVDVDE